MIALRRSASLGPRFSRSRFLRAAGTLVRCLLIGLVGGPASSVDANDIAAGIYVRTDTDGTTVVTPSASAEVGIIDDRTAVNIGYAADIWTSASIDIRTAATRRITEQRDELTAGVTRELGDVDISGSYRFSHEGDYVSHGGALRASFELGEGSSTIDAAALLAIDTVSRAGDDAFRREVGTVGARLGYTQIIDPETIVAGTLEITRREGYQASPYRFVGVGGDGQCGGSAMLCLPETHPNERIRTAAVVRGRRAFGEQWSAGLAYRFYIDDWSLASHTAIGQASFVPVDGSTLTLRYRFYIQSAASFYERRYAMPTGRLQFVTRDRELSPMNTHRLVLSFERAFDLTAAGPEARLTLALGGAVLNYSDFDGLDTILALDATVGMVLTL
ncbi:MAG: DUF3570 domain-containing protein [Myxococcota bacterium]